MIGPTGVRVWIDAVVDTGYTGSLILPTATIATLGLIRKSGGTSLLADGSTCHYDNYSAEVEWDGTTRGVVVSAIGPEALIGMVLLAGHKLLVEVEDGGSVEVLSIRP